MLYLCTRKKKGKQKTMKLTKIILCLGLMCMAFAGTAEAKKHKVVKKDLYMIGVAVSHPDSAVFITDLQPVKGLMVEKKTKFLMDRQLYSIQLKRYLEEDYKGGPYVAAVYFSSKLKKMERRYLSLHKRYSKGRELRIVLVDQSRFRFKAEEYIPQDDVTVATSKGKKKKKN